MNQDLGGSQVHTNTANKKAWYKHGWGLVVAILFFPYFLVWYAWAKSNWGKNLKVGISAVVGVFVMLIAVGAATTEPSDTSQSKAALVTQQQPKAPQETKQLPALTQKEAEAKAAAEAAAQKKAEEEAAAAAAAAKRSAELAAQSNATTTQTSTPVAEPSSNLPLKAICNDGSISYQDTPSQPDYRGMCSGHGGIKTKLGRVP